MVPKFLAVALLATIVAAEIPPYMKICGRKNPNLSACVKDSVENLREKLRTGMPELDVPSLEPMMFAALPLADTPQLMAHATNVKFHGFSNFEAKDLKIDLENKQLEMEIYFKELILDADYAVKAKILVPIEGKGPINILTKGITAKVTLKYKLIKKNGEEYMFFPSMTTKLHIDDYTADFRPTEGADSEVLRQAVNAAIEGGHKEILDTITPTLERVISEEVLRLSNKICKNFTYNELFPDRE